MTLRKKEVKRSKNPLPQAGGFFLANLPKDLLGIQDLRKDTIQKILTIASQFKREYHSPKQKREDLKGRTVVNLFFEPSTRTRASFDLAARRLSADLITMTPQSSSLSKGESLKDMVENLEAMSPDILVVRHDSSGVPGLIASHTRAAVINAGDGSHEHPTQALVDLFTVQKILGRIQGVRLLIVGDLAYSRVARSNIYGFRKMGARVTCVGPATLIPPGLERFGVRVDTELNRNLREADVVMLLRIQKERQEKLNFPSLSEYTRFYGLTRERAALMSKGALIMHPGPINRGVEIDPEVADGQFENGPRSVILEQVKNATAVRMAVLAIWGHRMNSDT